MLDIKFLRENIEVVKAGANKKHIACDFDQLLLLDDKRLHLVGEVEVLRVEQHHVSDKLGKPQISEEERGSLLHRLQEVKELLHKKDKGLKEAMREWHAIMLSVPNIPDISVPEGTDYTENQEVHAWGEKTEFTFEPKDHIELTTNIHMLDVERGTTVAGFRG